MARASPQSREVGRAQLASGGRAVLEERRAAPPGADRRAALWLGPVDQPRAAPVARRFCRARGRAPGAAARERPAWAAYSQSRRRSDGGGCVPQERKVLI